MKTSTILLLFFSGGIMLAAGCTVPLSHGATTPATTLPANPGTVAAPSQSLLPSPTTFWPKAPRIGEFTTVPLPRPAADNPHLDNLAIRKRTFLNPLPECLMEQAFPAIAKDPEYGIRQVEPKLAAVSREDYETFLRKFTEGNAENTPLKTPGVCLGSEAEPVWNFIEVRAVLVPTNFYPSDYTITENVWSDGKIVARFSTTERLTIDEQFVMTGYVPLHADEVDRFDSVELTYTRH